MTTETNVKFKFKFLVLSYGDGSRFDEVNRQPSYDYELNQIKVFKVDKK